MGLLKGYENVLFLGSKWYKNVLFFIELARGWVFDDRGILWHNISDLDHNKKRNTAHEKNSFRRS